MAKGRWTDSEVAFLKANYLTKGVKHCAEHIGKSIHCCYYKANRLGIHKEERYSESEIEYIVKNYAAVGPDGISKVLNRSRTAIRNMGVRLGLSVGESCLKKRGRKARAKWTKESSRKQSEKMRLIRGDNHHSWKGGVAKLREYARGRLHSAWGRFVFERDDYTCRLCGIRGDKMVVHHVRTFAQIRDAVLNKHPELDASNQFDKELLADLIVEAHNLKDGITLCRSCHDKHHLENGKNCGNILPDNAGDNPQPSLPNVLRFVGRKVQRPTLEDAQSNKSDTSIPLAVPAAR